MRRRTGKGLLALALGAVLALAAVAGVAPRAALAEGERAYAAYDVTTETNRVKTGDDLRALQVTFNGVKWYVIKDESRSESSGTLTLLAADALKEDEDTYLTSQFHDTSSAYSTSTIRGVLDAMTKDSGSFAGVAGAIETIKVKGSDSDVEVDAKLWLLSVQEANELPEAVRKAAGNCWLRSHGSGDDRAAFVYGNGSVSAYGTLVNSVLGVRPALKLNLESVIFESQTRTFSLPVDVTGVTLNPPTAQTIDVGEAVKLVATVDPNNATDQMVKWSVDGDAVELYADEDCKTPVTLDKAIETLTVYAKGVSAGTATVSVTSNDKAEATATCEVTVRAPAPEPTPEPAPEPDPEPAADTVPIHRLYNPYSGEHFYTASDVERDGLVSLGWQSEGEGWAAPAKSETPVYRLYNGNAGEHHFTASAAERDALVAAGWSDEGIGWYSDDARGVAVCREYNPNAFACNHNYTASQAEHDLLVRLGWDDEGVAWYGLAA